MNETIKYYNENADKYAISTQHVDMSDIHTRFLKHVKPSGSILDFGCGAGRDSLAFLQRGYQVDALDGSLELCKKAHKLTKLNIQHLDFFDFNKREQYDGVWACASLLHIQTDKLPDVIGHIVISLKQSGAFYLSFKYGVFEGIRNDRFFNDFNNGKLTSLMQKFPELVEVDVWKTEDIRKDRQNEYWLNAIYVKK